MTRKSILRIVTTGSVDDGKSTLIGRLLYETKSIYEDQLEAIRKTSLRKGLADVDLALLLDGLSAEREQGITIDVAHRYFETPARKFIIADCPGHVQYTRNMVTGASTADCALILIDARNGVLTQSKRHGFIVSLLRVPHLVVAVNKMDLVDYSEETFGRIVEAYRTFAEKLEIGDLTFIPVSALRGDNVLEKSPDMPWYEGPPLLHHLENLQLTSDRNLIDFRFPVQYVLRPHLDFRGFAGRIASGTIRPGEEIVVLPSGTPSTVKSIHTPDGCLEEGFAGQSLALTLEDEVDVSRGDMIVRRHNLPSMEHHFEATLCWMSEAPLRPGTSYLLKHTTRTVRASVSKLFYAIDVDTLHRRKVESYGLNDLGRVAIQTASPIFFDPYKNNRATGSFILIDPDSNQTVAAGMIRGTPMTLEDLLDQDGGEAHPEKSPHTVWREWNIPREQREAHGTHRAAVLWFTGLSGSGKSTLARALEKRLFERGCRTMLLDGDQLRHGLCRDLGFSRLDRSENIRRVSEVARLFFEAGHIVLCTFISPFERDRAQARGLIPEGRFFELHMQCDLETCIARDPHGLYKKALHGEIPDFTGISSPYEPPEHPEIVLSTTEHAAETLVEGLLERLEEAGIL